MNRGARLKAATIAVLTLATMALFNLDGRFTGTGPDLLPFPGEGPGQWFGRQAEVRRLDGGGWEATLTAGATGRTALIGWQLENPGAIGHLRVSGEIAAAGLDPDDDGSQAGFALNEFDASGRLLWYWPRIVAELHKPAGWQRHEKVLPMNPDAAFVRLIVFATGPGTTLTVRGLSLTEAAESGAWTAARWAMILLWAAAGVWIAVPALAGPGRSAASILAVVSGAAIIFLALVPQPHLYQSVRGFVVGLDRMVAGEPAEPPSLAVETQGGDGLSAQEENPPGPAQQGDAPGDAARAPSPPPGPGPFTRLGRQDLLGLDWQDLGHMSAHAIFAFLLFAALPGVPLRHRLLFVVLAAIASETLQSFTITRSVRAEDFALNIGGVLAGALAWLAVTGLRGRPGAESA